MAKTKDIFGYHRSTWQDQKVTPEQRAASHNALLALGISSRMISKIAKDAAKESAKYEAQAKKLGLSPSRTQEWAIKLLPYLGWRLVKILHIFPNDQDGGIVGLIMVNPKSRGKPKAKDTVGLWVNGATGDGPGSIRVDKDFVL